MALDGKFPNGLAEAMRRSGRTNFAELGRLISRPRQDIERWAKGQVRLTPDVAIELAPHVNATPEQLLLLNTPSSPIPLISWISAGSLAQPRAVPI